MIVATVLRSGGDFTPAWVHALERGVSEHLPIPHEFAVLSDVPVPGHIPYRLAHDWPGWWAKINALNPEVFSGPVLLLDLDTLPVGDFSDLASHSLDFAMLRALHPAKAKHGIMVSGVLAFQAGPGTEAARLYELFASDPERWVREYRGDGEFLADHARHPEAIQDHFPGRVCSYKWEARQGAPEGVALVCGHGQPRLSDPKAGWAHRLWRERAQYRTTRDMNRMVSVLNAPTGFRLRL